MERGLSLKPLFKKAGRHSPHLLMVEGREEFSNSMSSDWFKWLKVDSGSSPLVLSGGWGGWGQAARHKSQNAHPACRHPAPPRHAGRRDMTCHARRSGKASSIISGNADARAAWGGKLITVAGSQGSPSQEEGLRAHP